MTRQNAHALCNLDDQHGGGARENLREGAFPAGVQMRDDYVGHLQIRRSGAKERGKSLQAAGRGADGDDREGGIAFALAFLFIFRGAAAGANTGFFIFFFGREMSSYDPIIRTRHTIQYIDRCGVYPRRGSWQKALPPPNLGQWDDSDKVLRCRRCETGGRLGHGSLRKPIICRA